MAEAVLKHVEAVRTKVSEKNLGGRPSVCTPDVALEICERIAGGESLRRICQSDHLPNARTVHRWIIRPVGEVQEWFCQQYAVARLTQAQNMFDEILDIADDGANDYMTIHKGDNSYNVEDREVVNRSRLRVDSRKWYLSKVLPKVYGDKLDLTSGGKELPSPIMALEPKKEKDTIIDVTPVESPEAEPTVSQASVPAPKSSDDVL